MLKPVLGPRDHTNPLIWCAAIICAILAVAVIIAGMVVFIGYLVIKPRVPQISVSAARLDTIYFDQTSLLTIQATIVIKAENHNAQAVATFYDTSLWLGFGGQRIANLRASAYQVSPNNSKEMNYEPQPSSIPLSPEDAEMVNLALKQNLINFELKGKTGTRWRVWLIGPVNFWLHLDCQLHLPVNGTETYPRCSSRSK